MRITQHGPVERPTKSCLGFLLCVSVYACVCVCVCMCWGVVAGSSVGNLVEEHVVMGGASGSLLSLFLVGSILCEYDRSHRT